MKVASDLEAQEEALSLQDLTRLICHRAVLPCRRAGNQSVRETHTEQLSSFEMLIIESVIPVCCEYVQLLRHMFFSSCQGIDDRWTSDRGDSLGDLGLRER